MRKYSPRSRLVRPLVAAVVQPVERRLARMEALLVEMRHEQDVQLKRITKIRERVDALAEQVQESRPSGRRMRQRRK